MARKVRCKCPICNPPPLPELSSRLKADRKRARAFTAKRKSYRLDGELVAGGTYIMGGDGYSVHIKNKFPEMFREG